MDERKRPHICGLDRLLTGDCVHSSSLSSGLFLPLRARGEAAHYTTHIRNIALVFPSLNLRTLDRLFLARVKGTWGGRIGASQSAHGAYRQLSAHLRKRSVRANAAAAPALNPTCRFRGDTLQDLQCQLEKTGEAVKYVLVYLVLSRNVRTFEEGHSLRRDSRP